MRAEVEVAQIDHARRRVTLATRCLVGNTVVLKGEAVVLAPMMSKHIALVRTDALFALVVALGAFAAQRAWERGGGWAPFWFWAALATLLDIAGEGDAEAVYNLLGSVVTELNAAFITQMTSRLG